MASKKHIINKVYVDKNNKEPFLKKFSTLQKRGKSLGVLLDLKQESFEYVDMLAPIQERKYLTQQEMLVALESDPTLKFSPMLVYSVRLVMPDLKGMNIVAKLDHEKSGNIVALIDKQLFKKYPNTFGYVNKIEPVCDHCKQNRQRKYFYLAYNSNTNSFLRIGKSCLKNYNNTVDIEKIYTFLDSFSVFIEKDYFDRGDNTYFINFNNLVSNYLKMMYMDIQDKNKTTYIRENTTLLYGLEPEQFIKRGDSVSENAYWDKYTDYNENGYLEDMTWFNHYLQTASESQVEVYNLKIVSDVKVFKNKSVGTVLYSLFKVLNNYMTDKYVNQNKVDAITQLKTNTLDEYFGAEGEKYMNQIITFVSQSFYENDFGSGYILRFKDSDNRELTWFTQTYLVEKVEQEYLKQKGYSYEDIVNDTIEHKDKPTIDKLQGRKIKVNFTVKKHNLYQEKKSTIIKGIRKIELLPE